MQSKERNQFDLPSNNLIPQSLEENQVFEQLLIFQSGNLEPKEIAHLSTKISIFFGLSVLILFFDCKQPHRLLRTTIL